MKRTLNRVKREYREQWAAHVKIANGGNWAAVQSSAHRLAILRAEFQVIQEDGEFAVV